MQDQPASSVTDWPNPLGGLRLTSRPRVGPALVGPVEEGHFLPGSAKLLNRRPPKALPHPSRDGDAGQVCRCLEAGLLVLGDSDLERQWS